MEISPLEAKKLAKKSHGINICVVTVRNWLLKYEGLGRKVGGRWMIDKEAFQEFLEGDCSEETEEEEE